MKVFKIKKTIAVLITCIALISFGSAMAKNAATVAKPAKKLINTDRVNSAVVTPVLKCDLEVRHINATQCFCVDALDNVRAMLYKDIWVTVGNYLCPGGIGADNVKAELEVKYFDLMSNRMVTHRMPLTLEKNRTRNIKVKNGHVLIKQNPGITATIKFRTNTFKIVDCDPSNNQRTERECQLPLVY